LDALAASNVSAPRGTRTLGDAFSKRKQTLQGAAMASIKEIANQFFEACEAGKGWEACKAFCKPSATFSAQAEPLAKVQTLHEYADWMQSLMKMLPDGHYELKSFATDDQRATVTAYAVFCGTHTGQGGLPPTGKSTRSTDCCPCEASTSACAAYPNTAVEEGVNHRE
jgi:predicted ester cyclase